MEVKGKERQGDKGGTIRRGCRGDKEVRDEENEGGYVGGI